MSQTKLARLAGCRNNHLSQIELGKVGCSLILGRKLATVLGCRVEELCRDSGTLEMDERDLLKAYRALTVIQRAQIRAFILGLTASGGDTRAALLATDLDTALSRVDTQGRRG